MGTKSINQKGASTEAIEHHYDISNEFYELWLDSSMIYSAALWDTAEDLSTAQKHKLDFHIKNARATKAQNVLDVGCGWGGLLKTLTSKEHQVEKAIGLTLSKNQKSWIDKKHSDKYEVRLESWKDHNPNCLYDAIISIGAIEHFATPELTREQKIKEYNLFFQKCHEWLKPDGHIALQAIVYENTSIEKYSNFMVENVFPESNLPHLSEILQATEGLFEVITLRNDREQYIRTLRIWLHNLRKNKSQAIALVGKEIYTRYDKYLSLSMVFFHTSTSNLTRIAFKRIGT